MTDEKDPGASPAQPQPGAGGPAASENQQAGPPKPAAEAAGQPVPRYPAAPAAGWMPPPPAGAAPAEVPSAQPAPDRGAPPPPATPAGPPAPAASADAAPPAQDTQAPPGLPETADAVAEAEMAAAPAPPPAVTETDKPTVIVRYGAMGLLGRLICMLSPWRCGQRVVIKSERGQEIGTLVCAWGGCGSPSGVPPHIRGEVLRAVTHADEVEARHLAESERREFAFSKECVAKRTLPMKMVAVEHLFGGDRIVFHFVSESRVDFRALVRDLAHEFQTRIEMRQIGVRDEARLLGDYERCGRPLCCRAWIKELEPVSMKMAKIQKATLDPTKISGRCGRLMCCLRFEHATYRDLARTLPRKNTLVMTAQGPGKVIDVDVISQMVGVLLGTGNRINVPVESLRSGAAAGEPPDPAPEALPEEEAEIEMVADLARQGDAVASPAAEDEAASPDGPLPPNGGAPEAPAPTAQPAPAAAPVSPAAPGGQPGQGGQRQGGQRQGGQPGQGGPQQGEHCHRRGRRRSRRGGRNRGRPAGQPPPAQPPQGGRGPSGPAPSQGN